MGSLLLFKVAAWMVVIGLVALVTPNPAWPEWLARMILSAGIALAVTTAGLRWWRGRTRRRRAGP
jgi:hypothetical protein